MRIASYNVENLFDRARAMNLDSWAEGKPVLEDFANLNKLLGQVTYTAADKKEMVKLIKSLGLAQSDTAPFVLLRRNRGKLLTRGAAGVQIVANGRADWAGSLELRDEPVNEVSMRNTAQVMIDIKADILGVVEAESRPVLAAFNTEIIASLKGKPFRHVMLIDGNDQRGIDVGILSRDDYPIGLMRSHADEHSKSGEPIFSRDCPEFYVTTPTGKQILVLMNHLKSKGYGSPAASAKRRAAQAMRVAEIYKGLVADGHKHVVVMGDFNDTPDSEPLKPVLKNTDLKDISEHPNFADGGFPGTYGSSTKNNKIDYMLFSPDLFAKVTGGGIFRKGMWPGVRPVKWPAYATITREIEAASDHAAVYADLNF